MTLIYTQSDNNIKTNTNKSVIINIHGTNIEVNTKMILIIRKFNKNKLLVKVVKIGEVLNVRI